MAAAKINDPIYHGLRHQEHYFYCRKIVTGNPGKTGYSGNMGNGYMQRIVLLQSVFSLATSVAASADYYYYIIQLVCNSFRGLKQSLVILSFDPLLNCLFNNLSILVIFQLRMS